MGKLKKTFFNEMSSSSSEREEIKYNRERTSTSMIGDHFLDAIRKPYDSEHDSIIQT